MKISNYFLITNNHLYETSGTDSFIMLQDPMLLAHYLYAILVNQCLTLTVILVWIYYISSIKLILTAIYWTEENMSIIDRCYKQTPMGLNEKFSRYGQVFCYLVKSVEYSHRIEVSVTAMSIRTLDLYYQRVPCYVGYADGTIQMFKSFH